MNWLKAKLDLSSHSQTWFGHGDLKKQPNGRFQEWLTYQNYCKNPIITNPGHKTTQNKI